MPLFKKAGCIWVNLQVPTALHDIARHLAVDSGSSVQAVYLGLIRKALEDRHAEEIREEI